jgi:preprotein translocase subunit SecA
VPPIIDSVLRAGEGKILRKLKRISEQINSIEDDFVKMSDAELRGMTDEFRQRYADGETLDDLLPEAFATVREAAKRTWASGLRRAADGRRRAAPGQHRRDEDR